MLQARGIDERRIVRYVYRPFDRRWLYWESQHGLLDRERSDYVPHVGPDNLWIEARQKQPTDAFDRGYVVRDLADNFGNGLSSYFPLFVNSTEADGALFAGSRPNLSRAALTYLENVRGTPRALFAHAVAIQHARAFRVQNAGGLRGDWPRIPLPSTQTQLIVSAALGDRLIGAFVSEGSDDKLEALRSIGSIARLNGGHLNPATELFVTARWGVRGQGGVTMPSRGKYLERAYTPDERTAVAEAAAANELSLDQAISLLGETTFDVYLNEVAFWRNVPKNVWGYTLGSYQVIKKWLSYREAPILGRPLTVEEVREVSDIARRIAAIILMGPALDANYEAVKADPYSWPPTTR